MSSAGAAFEQKILDINYNGAIMAAMLYGYYVCLTTSNIHQLVQTRRYKLAIFSVFVLAITTIYNAININYSQKLLIDAPLNPGLKIPLWPQVARDATYTVNTWLTDGYLLFRCFIVWSGPWQNFVMIIPTLLYLASVGCSIALLIFSGSPGSTYSTAIVQAFGTSNWSISLALNTVLTALIASRLIYYRKRIQRVLGRVRKHNYV